MDNNKPPYWEEREMIAMHIPALLENADTICSIPELGEAPIPHMCVHMYGGAPRVTLGDMLRVWGAKEDTPGATSARRGTPATACCTFSAFPAAGVQRPSIPSPNAQ